MGNNLFLTLAHHVHLVRSCMVQPAKYNIGYETGNTFPFLGVIFSSKSPLIQ